MKTDIQIFHDKLEGRPQPDWSDAGAGAWVEFRGTVRGTENNQPICALEYEAYEPMAVDMLEKLARQSCLDSGCSHFLAWHRVGVVPVGDAAVILKCGAPHRQQAFACVSNFLERLKQDVPIWKVRALPAKEPSQIIGS
jgi:molybdopterin synthase catalytic subunit